MKINVMNLNYRKNVLIDKTALPNILAYQALYQRCTSL